jgi:hypothetical protein
MEEQLVSFETAKLAKEKGFNIECKYRYFKVDKHSTFSKFHPIDSYITSTLTYEEDTSGCLPSSKTGEAPTQSLLQKWLREVYNTHLMVEPFYNEQKVLVYGFDLITERIEEETIVEKGFKTYEEALEVGLQEALKLIK